MNQIASDQLQAAPRDVRNAIARAASTLPPIERFELVTGARYGIEEQAGKAPPLSDDDRRTLGRFFFQGRDIVLAARVTH